MNQFHSTSSYSVLPKAYALQNKDILCGPFMTQKENYKQSKYLLTMFLSLVFAF
jgi:hypothetical protein